MLSYNEATSLPSATETGDPVIRENSLESITDLAAVAAALKKSSEDSYCPDHALFVAGFTVWYLRKEPSYRQTLDMNANATYLLITPL